jgi:phage/plasmid-like protein (TIGR03299 family)
MTAREALVAGGVDYEVEKRPLWAEENGLATLAIPGHFATVRTDTNQPLGVVGSRYAIVQNRDALSFFDPALGEGAASIDSVGSLAGGKRAFMLAKIPEVVEIVPGDAVERYLLFSNSHDGSSAVEVLFTPVRVVCQNTLSAALADAKKKKAGRVSIRHTAGAKERLEAAHEVLGQERDYFTRIKAAFQYLAKRDLGRAEVASFVRDLFPGKLDAETKKITVSTKTRNRRKAVVKAFEESPGSDMAGSTAWGLYNAATWFIDHERNLPEGSDPWEASVVGSGVGLRQSAFDLALKL